MRVSSPTSGPPVPAMASCAPRAASSAVAGLSSHAPCLTALAGVLGTATAALGAYDATVLAPLPADNAAAAQVFTFGLHDRASILIDVALQARGWTHSVSCAPALIHLAGATHRRAGRLTVGWRGVRGLTLAAHDGATPRERILRLDTVRSEEATGRRTADAGGVRV